MNRWTSALLSTTAALCCLGVPNSTAFSVPLPTPNRLTLFSYNCFAATTWDRVTQILRELRGDVVMLQGTQHKQLGTNLVHTRSTEYLHAVEQIDYGTHIGLHWGWGKGNYTNRACGVCTLLEKERLPTSSILKLYSPPQSLQGRAGAVRIRRASIDICLVNAYFPCEPQSAEELKAVTALSDWIHHLLTELPARTIVILATDANGHTGNTSDFQKGCAIGPEEPQIENNNGYHFRTLLDHFQLYAPSTYNRAAAGPTFWAASGQGSRVDYFAIPWSLRHQLHSIQIWRRAGRRLQMIRTARPRDHCPLRMQINVAIPHEKQEQQYRRWNFDNIRSPQKCRFFAEDLQSAQQDPQYRTNMQHSLEHGTPDTSWDIINGAALQAAKRHFLYDDTAYKNPRISDATRALQRTAKQKYQELQHTYNIHNTNNNNNNNNFPQQQSQHLDTLRTSILAGWKAAAALQRADRNASASARKDRRAYYARIAEDMKQAEHDHDSRKVWLLARRLAATGVGPRLRQWGAPLTENPPADEWLSATERPGAEGGCLATLYHSVDRTPLDVEPSLADIEVAQGDYNATLQYLSKSRNNKQVPMWSVPAEVWKVVMCSLKRMQWTHNYFQPFRQDVRRFLAQVRQFQAAPQLWHHSLAIKLPKHNKKQGIKSIRLVHALDPFGKAYFRALWDLGSHTTWPFAMGLARHRRREQAIMQQRILAWRLQQAKQSHALLLFDVANAFPSPNFEALDAVVTRQFNIQDQTIMQQRHREASTTILTHEDIPLNLKIGSGSLQGDGVAGFEFAEVYNPRVQRYLDRMTEAGLASPFLVVDWLTGDVINA
ncbi:unnamed protein product, partial [Polarella glacialis]